MNDIISSTYDLIGEIGSGGGGIVYLANHKRLGKKVVLKADKRKITTRPEILRREVDALKNLNHTYIPKVYDFFIENDTVYTVMDYIEGESLDKPLKKGKRFSQAQVIQWACELLEALCYLHAPTHGNPPRGIVHSDIKPANIMLTPHGHICLIDFNIALVLGEVNLVGHSPGYASPEHYGLDYSSGHTGPVSDYQATELMDSTDFPTAGNNGRISSSPKRLVVPDVRSDIYSLGATLYHLLSGKRPSQSALEVIPLSDREYSAPLAAIITKAMNPNPDLRYQSAEEMLTAFRQLRENDPRTKQYRRMGKLGYAACAVLTAAGILLTFAGLRGREAVQKARTLNGYAEEALMTGDRESAVRHIREMVRLYGGAAGQYLPAEMRYTMTDALGVYSLSDSYRVKRVLTMPSEVLKCAVSPNGAYLAVLSDFSVSVCDAEEGIVLDVLPTVKSVLADIVFLNNHTFLYAGENGLTCYDIGQKKVLWMGEAATAIAVSGDGTRIAGLYRGEMSAVIYNTDGEKLGKVSFDGKKQRIPSDDTFVDPKGRMFALSEDGGYLAVSFEDGSLTLFSTERDDVTVPLMEASEYTAFDGGFSGDWFAYTASSAQKSTVMTFDMRSMQATGGMTKESTFLLCTGAEGILLANEGIAVRLDPETWEQTELGYTDQKLRSFAGDGTDTVFVTDKGYLVFGTGALCMLEQEAAYVYTDAVLHGGTAVLFGTDSSELLILSDEDHTDADCFPYNAEYLHDEARVTEDGSRLMLFSWLGFQLYDNNGKLLCETELPNPEKLYDQRFYKASGNLANLYDDELRIYSGETGELLLCETGLRSVVCDNSCISILTGDGVLYTVNPDTAEKTEAGSTDGSFAAYSGGIVDETVLAGREWLGSGRCGGDFWFAVGDKDGAALYQNGIYRYTVPGAELSEVYFAETCFAVSPLHGTPILYRLKDGHRITEMEKDAYLTYLTEIPNGILSEYVTTDGRRYGVLLDVETAEPTAALPYLTDCSGNTVLFDYGTGVLRKTALYSIDELLRLLEETKPCVFSEKNGNSIE